MEPSSFQYYFEKWSSRNGAAHQRFLQGLKEQMQLLPDFTLDTHDGGLTKDEKEKLQDFLTKTLNDLSEFYHVLSQIVETDQQYLAQIQFSTPSSSSSSGEEKELHWQQSIGLTDYQGYVDQLPKDHPCLSQFDIIISILKNVVHLLVRYAQDFQKITNVCSDLIRAQGKLLALHYKRCFLNGFVSALTVFLKEVLTTKLPQELQNVNQHQHGIAQEQKKLYQEVSIVFEHDVRLTQNLISLLMKMNFETSTLTSLSLTLSELSLQNKTWCLEQRVEDNPHTKKQPGSSYILFGIVMFPILGELYSGLNQCLNKISVWSQDYVSSQQMISGIQGKSGDPEPSVLTRVLKSSPTMLVGSSNSQETKSAGEIPVIPSASVTAPDHSMRDLPYVQLLLGYVESTQKKLHNQVNEADKTLQILLRDQKNLETNIKRQEEERDKIYSESLKVSLHSSDAQKNRKNGNSPSSFHMDRFVAQHQTLDPSVAKHLLDLEQKQHLARLQRHVALDQFRQKYSQIKDTKLNMDLLKQVASFLKLWDERERRWQNYMKKELLLISAWKKLKSIYYHRIYQLISKWNSLTRMEWSVVIETCQLINQRMNHQVFLFHQQQWNVLKKRQAQIFSHIGNLGGLLRSILQQISLICPKECQTIHKIYHNTQLAMEKIENYWEARYQRDMVLSIRDSISYLASLVHYLLQDLQTPVEKSDELATTATTAPTAPGAPRVTLAQFLHVKKLIQNLLREREQQMNLLLFPEIRVDERFKEAIEKILKTHNISQSADGLGPRPIQDQQQAPHV